MFSLDEDHVKVQLIFINPRPTVMAFTRVTNAHGPSPQPTVCMSQTYSLTTATGSNQAKICCLCYFPTTLQKKTR